MDRRKGWTSARAAGLQLIADLERLIDELEGGAAPHDLGSNVWAAHREALLFRQGNFPSGLDAANWLNLARCFNELDQMTEAELDEAGRQKSLVQLRHAVQVLQVFEPDQPAVGVFLRRTWARFFRLLGVKGSRGAPGSAPTRSNIGRG
jgi:hypothetical protein